MKRIALILSGCGYLDGSEINEVVLTLLELSKIGAIVKIFAPNIAQLEVIDHTTDVKVPETRNVMVEAARIARGKILALDELKPDDFDSVIIPGGFGVAKNIFSITDEFILPLLRNLLTDFYAAKKPIGCICIAPALIAILLKDKNPDLTLGNESNILEKIGVKNFKCNTDDIIVDEKNLLVSTPAFMHDDSLANVHKGISKLVNKIIELA